MRIMRFNEMFDDENLKHNMRGNGDISNWKPVDMSPISTLVRNIGHHIPLLNYFNIGQKGDNEISFHARIGNSAIGILIEYSNENGKYRLTNVFDSEIRTQIITADRNEISKKVKEFIDDLRKEGIEVPKVVEPSWN